MSAAVKIGPRTARRLIEVLVPEWSPEPITMIEPSVRDYITVSKVADQQERAVQLLGACVLGENGKPVGVDAIMAAPISAFTALSAHLPPLLGQEETTSPLASQTSSNTDSPSPSEE